MYEIVKERYSKLLKTLDIKEGTKLWDAGSGIGIFSNYLDKKGFKVTASDISKDALEGIDNKNIIKICTSIERVKVPTQYFEISHCFDVLYHILDDKEWDKSIKNLCNLSNKYVILHERFQKRKQLISSKHVNARPYKKTIDTLEKYGFKEYKSTATHFIAQRLFTYKFSKYFPKTFYKIDKFILQILDTLKLNSLGSHHIKVFKRW
jgi:cyclopropane fatty-acyl-phospholipid synthase-like methyltransferase